MQIDGLKYVISQYADDTTLILRPGDQQAADENLATWTGGTAMAENSAKREGWLLGRLARERHREPQQIIHNNEWVRDGSTIRALGAPLGNQIDEHAWWMGKYRTVKGRVARWPSLRRLSVTGRNMLLQSIFYGSFRFWLYFMVLPASITKLIEQDAKQILWATTPHIDSTEDGSPKCRRWITERASYLPLHKGGAGVMHWPSHCEAYYATWIIRYLHPRKAQWKNILRHYIDNEFIHDGILVAAALDRDRSAQLPLSATYIRRCLRSFAMLRLTQNTDLLPW